MQKSVLQRFSKIMQKVEAAIFDIKIFDILMAGLKFGYNGRYWQNLKTKKQILKN